MTIRLRISGMTCGHCEMAIRKALEAVTGVSRVISVSKDRGEAVVEGSASAEALENAVIGEGYQLEGIE